MKTLIMVLLVVFTTSLLLATTFDIADGDTTGLIAAIDTANANAEPDIINLAVAGAYTISTYTTEYPCRIGFPIITTPITINGNGSTIQRSKMAGTPGFIIFFIEGPDAGELTIKSATICGGESLNGGSAIHNLNGLLRLSECTITKNIDHFFGAVWNRGYQAKLYAENCSFSYNDSRLRGGAIYNLAGFASFKNCIIDHNYCDAGGGVLNHLPGSVLVFTNCTISSNWSRNAGGAVFNSEGQVYCYNTTITDNVDYGRGRAIDNFNGYVYIKNSIFSNPAQNFYGQTFSLGYNIVSDLSLLNPQPNDLINTDPLIDTLSDNGGPTKTHALLPTSPAIDAIPIEECVDYNGNLIVTDQRGVIRPQNSYCDIGAFECMSYTFSIYGYISLLDFEDDMTSVPIAVELRKQGGATTITTINLDSGGGFTISDIPQGEYDIAFKASHWLRDTLLNVSVNGNVTGLAVSLINGDVDGDNDIDTADLAALKDADKKPVNPNADLNGDGKINGQDMKIIRDNLGSIGDP